MMVCLMFFKCQIRGIVSHPLPTVYIKRKHQAQKQATTKITISIIDEYHGQSKEPSH